MVGKSQPVERFVQRQSCECLNVEMTDDGVRRYKISYKWKPVWNKTQDANSFYKVKGFQVELLVPSSSPQGCLFTIPIWGYR